MALVSSLSKRREQLSKLASGMGTDNRQRAVSWCARSVAGVKEADLLWALDPASIVFVEYGCVVVHILGVWVMILFPLINHPCFYRNSPHSTSGRHRTVTFFILPVLLTGSASVNNIYILPQRNHR